MWQGLYIVQQSLKGRWNEYGRRIAVTLAFQSPPYVVRLLYNKRCYKIPSVSYFRSFLLTKNSIESKKKERIDQTIKRYRNFVNEFPESKYKRRLNTISDEMERQKESHKS